MRAVRVRKLYTGRYGEVLENVYIAWDGKEIAYVGTEKPRDAEIIDIENGVATPAFIDAHSHIGMVRSGEPMAEEESNDIMDSVLPLADAIHSVYMDDKAFRDSIEHGVLYSCVLPGSGNIIGGKAAVIRNYAHDIEDAFIKSAGIKAALGYNPRSVKDWKGTRPSTRMGAISILRKWLIKALDAAKLIEKGKKDPEEFDPEVRALIPVVRGEELLRVHVHKQDDIAALIALKKELELRVTIEHACDVHSAETVRKIARESIPVVYGPMDSFPYKTELKHESWRNLRFFIEEGMVEKGLLGLMSDHPVILQRNIYLQLRFFVRLGLDFSKAISVLTMNNARILGVDKFLGSIEKGKWASFVVWNGEPLRMDSYPVLVVGEGKVLHEEV
ncbi:MAG: amidohydrolase [Crenarchaeota archaeon]|nr:amidohydrolase [Thermoproteota archaeon]